MDVRLTLALDFLGGLDEWQGDPVAAEAGYRRFLSARRNPKIQRRLASLLERQGRKPEAAELQSERLGFLERAVAANHEGYLRELATLDAEAETLRTRGTARSARHGTAPERGKLLPLSKHLEKRRRRERLARQAGINET